MMKHLITFILTLLLLTSCSSDPNITFPYIISTANGYPLLKYSTKSCTVSTLCPDVYCEHKSSGDMDELCEFAQVSDFAFGGEGIYYIAAPVVDEDGIRYPLKYYSYVTGKIRLITERNMMNKLFYHDGSLYFWEVSGDEGQVSGDTIRHLYRYHEKTGRITRLTDEDTCYGMENSPWLMLPDMIYADDRYLYLVSYPDYYRADHDFGNLEKISVAELPKDVSVRINDVTYSLNGMLYTIPDGTNTLIGQNIETGEIEVIADAVVSFVMNENGLCYQPRYEEAEEIEGRFNRSHGQIYCYDIKSGEHTVILNEPDRHLSSAMHLSDGVLMVQIYGYSTDAHGEERYDILPDALMYKDGVWVEVRSDIR